MAFATSWLPDPMIKELTRGEFSVYDTNNLLWCWPVVSAIASCQAATFGAFASATHNVTGGPEAGVGVASGAPQFIRAIYQDVHWFFPCGTPTKIPNFITTILTASEAGNPSPYTVG